MSSYPLVNRVVFGSGGTAIEVDQVSGGLGLAVEVTPARMPVEVYDGAGDLHLVSGPGADRVRVRIEGAGRRVPVLTGLSLGALPVTVYWGAGGTTTTLSLVTAGVQSRQSDLPGCTVQWALEGVGLVTAGTDPLGR